MPSAVDKLQNSSFEERVKVHGLVAVIVLEFEEKKEF